MTRLAGWSQEDHVAALALWTDAPHLAAGDGSARTVLEQTFRAGATIPAHVTGYYEPELDGSLRRTPDFPVPVHSAPPHPVTAARADMADALEGYEICWLRDEVDRFFLQVQGSGRIRLPGGGAMRLGFAAKNDRPYRSIGKLLQDRGHLGADITADMVKDWLREDPARGRAVMDENQSYVMFRTLDVAEADGPPGTMGLPVVPLRSIAVDPKYHRLGRLFWLEVGPLRRLVIAHDTGSAIKGHGRVDLFHGTGILAGRSAGALNAPGCLTPLLVR